MNVIGTVYLLHFDRPFGHARHYTGWTTDLDSRLACHAAGHGAHLLAVVHAAGIGWTLARTWEGTRGLERRLKRRGGASRYCPLCGITPRGTTTGTRRPWRPDFRVVKVDGATGRRTTVARTITCDRAMAKKAWHRANTAAGSSDAFHIQPITHRGGAA